MRVFCKHVRQSEVFFYNEDIVLHPGDDCRDVPSAER